MYSKHCTYFILFSFRIKWQSHKLTLVLFSGLTNWYFWRIVTLKYNSELKIPNYRHHRNNCHPYYMVHVIIWTFVQAIAIVFVTHASSSSYTSSTSMSNTTVVFSVGRTEQAMTRREAGCIIHGRSLLTLSTSLPVPSVASESLSNAPLLYAHLLPLILWDHPREPPPPSPLPSPTETSNTQCGWGGGVGGGGLWGWRSGAIIQTQDFREKRKLEWRVKVVIYFRKSSLRCRFLPIMKARNRLYAVKVKKHRDIYSYLTENRR